MRSYLVYTTLNILFSVVKNYTKKDPQSVSHCGFFDHPDLQSLHNYSFFFFLLQLWCYTFRACNIPLEKYFQDLSNGIL